MSKINSKYNQGFTLIELLVVIAIIGILSGIVLTSLGGARQKAEDARIKQNMSGFRTAAELFYVDFDSYQELEQAAVCWSSDHESLPPALAGYKNPTRPYIEALEGNTCLKNSRTYSLSVSLSDDTTWCVDSSGYFGKGVASGGDSVPAKCNAS